MLDHIIEVFGNELIINLEPTIKSICKPYETILDGQVLIFLSNLRTVPRARLSC